MILRITIILLVLTSLTASAQQGYEAAAIPKELLPHASAVVRNEEMSIEVQDLDNTIVHFKTAVTILNKNGDDMARIELAHDKSTVIKFVKGAIYNEFGKQTGKFTESNFEDNSAWDGFSLFLDTRVKHYFPAVTEYPYTIVYEYEQRLKQTLDFPEWDPIHYYGTAVEKSTYIFACKPDYAIRYKESNIQSGVGIAADKKGLKTYTWQLNNAKAMRHEPYSPYHDDFFPLVRIAPQKFEFYSITGSFNNWNELGKWEYDKLIASRQVLSPDVIQRVKDITRGIVDPKLKAKRIYEYMQSKTHYVSVQVGIGGWQPFLASDVDQQNYGDCKALVNYTQALLKAVDIESYYCVVQSGGAYKVSLQNDFASMGQGDHIILCLPFKNDTTWADCTSQTIPFGYLGDFTDDRTVLACTPEGGKLLHTPKYTYRDNLETHKADLTINEAGELAGTVSSVFKGTDYEDRNELINEPRSEQVKMLQRIYPVNNMLIQNLELKQDKSFDPATTETIKLQARDYATLTDGKYYFMLNALNRRTAPPAQVTNRLNQVYINRGYTENDNVNYTIPAGYRLEKTPLNMNIDKPFGKFTATMELIGNKLTYKRKLQLIDGTYSKDTYQDLVDFFQDVVDADNYTVSLVRHE